MACAHAGPGEIKRREVVLDPQESPGEIKRREVVLDPPREPRRDQEQGGGARLRKLDNPLLELFLNSCATDSLCDSAPQSS